jgi:2-polyprenyl-6-methoxyphenol hydroxylase-like FAD-dependent oxidoreductase
LSVESSVAAPYAFPVPSAQAFEPRPSEKTAVVIGAGPAGLIAALTLRDEGVGNVLVLERRTVFSRGNVVNLHPESLHALARLGVLRPFLERASLIADHRSDVHADGNELYRFSQTGHPVLIDPEASFDVDDVAAGFKNETLYGIALAELQDVLAAEAAGRGIQILSPAAGTVVPEPSGAHSVRAEIEGGLSFTVASPVLIVVADGARAAVPAELDAGEVAAEGLWPNEFWVFGNCRCAPPFGFSNLLFEFRGARCEDLTISNSIFLPRKGEVNVAITVRRPDLSYAETEALVAAQGARVLAISGVAGDGAVVWHSGRAVRIRPRSARRLHFGCNVVLAGDAAGANSPVAAFGGTLSTSAYSYAMRHLSRDLEALGAHAALSTYGRRVEACVARWHERVAEVRHAIETEVRPTSLRLVAAAPRERSANGTP